MNIRKLILLLFFPFLFLSTSCNQDDSIDTITEETESETTSEEQVPEEEPEPPEVS